MSKTMPKSPFEMKDIHGDSITLIFRRSVGVIIRFNEGEVESEMELTFSQSKELRKALKAAEKAL